MYIISYILYHTYYTIDIIPYITAAEIIWPHSIWGIFLFSTLYYFGWLFMVVLDTFFTLYYDVLTTMDYLKSDIETERVW